MSYPHFDPEAEGNPFEALNEREKFELRQWQAFTNGDHAVHDGRESANDEHAENGAHDAQAAIHDSRSPKNREIVNDGPKAPEATPLFGFEQPPPLTWTVAGLVPEGFVSLLAADGGAGKSFLAVYLSLCVCMGRSFFGLHTTRGRVLYVDYELDVEEQRRRVWRVAAGMGLDVSDDRLTDRFFYYRPSAPLGTDQAHAEVLDLIQRHDISLTILDSLTVASAGADVTASEDVVPVMQRFKEWGTVFAIDHISSNAARGNQSRATPFGSVFKRNIARSTFTLAKADGGGLMLTPDKSNFTAERDLVCYAIDFEGEAGPVCFSKVDATDDSMTGALKDMGSRDVTLTGVKTLYDERARPVSAEQIVTWRDGFDGVQHVKEGTVRNHLTVLRKRGKIELADGGAVPAGVAYTAPSDVGFEEGQTVTTPEGEGEVLEIMGTGRVAVRVDAEDHVFDAEEIDPGVPF